MLNPVLLRWLSAVLLLTLLPACISVSAASVPTASITVVPSVTSSTTPTVFTSVKACPVTEPVWEKPPDDPAVLNEPEFGYYFINQDRTIWASAVWAVSDEYPLHADKNGLKVGWFRPEGANLNITGWRTDGEAPPLKADIPCCYPTRFQVTGLYFTVQGCWEVTARAAESVLTFVVWVAP